MPRVDDTAPGRVSASFALVQRGGIGLWSALMSTGRATASLTGHPGDLPARGRERPLRPEAIDPTGGRAQNVQAGALSMSVDVHAAVSMCGTVVTQFDTQPHRGARSPASGGPWSEGDRGSLPPPPCKCGSTRDTSRQPEVGTGLDGPPVAVVDRPVWHACGTATRQRGNGMGAWSTGAVIRIPSSLPPRRAVVPLRSSLIARN